MKKAKELRWQWQKKRRKGSENRRVNEKEKFLFGKSSTTYFSGKVSLIIPLSRSFKKVLLVNVRLGRRAEDDETEHKLEPATSLYSELLIKRLASFTELCLLKREEQKEHC